MHPLSLSRDSVYGAAPFASLHWIERPKINLSILWSGSLNEHPIEVKSRAKEQFVQLSRDTGLAAVDNVQPCFLAWLVLVEQSAAQYVSLGFKYWWSCRCHNSKKAGFLLYHFSVTGKDILPRPECQRHARGSQTGLELKGVRCPGVLGVRPRYTKDYNIAHHITSCKCFMIVFVKSFMLSFVGVVDCGVF